MDSVRMPTPPQKKQEIDVCGEDLEDQDIKIKEMLKTVTFEYSYQDNMQKGCEGSAQDQFSLRNKAFFSGKNEIAESQLNSKISNLKKSQESIKSELNQIKHPDSPSIPFSKIKNQFFCTNHSLKIAEARCYLTIYYMGF